MSSVKSHLKFFVKVHLVARARSFLLLIAGVPVNKDGWQDRVLFVSLEGLGDMIVSTATLKHYKKHFGGKKTYLLANRVSQLDASLLSPFIDRVILVDYPAFVKNPFYGFRLINSLRRTGFKTVIDHDPYTTEINGKMICVSLGAEEVIGYEGPALVFERPFNEGMRMNVEFVTRKIHPRYTRVVPSIDRGKPLGEALISVIHHYRALYEAITRKKESDYSTALSVPDEAREQAEKTIASRGLAGKKYAVLDLGSSVAYKNWPVERFVETAAVLREAGFAVTLVGAKAEKELAERFKKKYTGACVDLVGETTIPEVVALIEKSSFLLSNDTGPVHIAVALKKPLLCILGGGQFGMISLYGYPAINKWAYKRTDCFGDNWRCSLTVPHGSPSPCVAAISVEMAKGALRELISSVMAVSAYPREKFQVEFKNIA